VCVAHSSSWQIIRSSGAWPRMDGASWFFREGTTAISRSIAGSPLTTLCLCLRFAISARPDTRKADIARRHLVTQPPHPSNPKRGAALAALVVAMIVWGSTFVVTKVAMQEFPPWTLAFLRFAIASLVLLAFMRGRGGLTKLRRSMSLWRLTFLALTGIALFTAAFNYALVYGSASQGALLYATIPAVLAVCAVLFLKERLNRGRVLGIALSVVGAALIVASGEPRLEVAPSPLLGAAFMLWTVVLWAAYTVAAKAVTDADQIVVIFAISVLGALMLLPASVVELAMVGLPSTSAHGFAIWRRPRPSCAS